jgi:hypothetical protein
MSALREFLKPQKLGKHEASVRNMPHMPQIATEVHLRPESRSPENATAQGI